MGLLGAGLMERKEEMKAEFGGAGSQHHARPPLPAIRGSRWQTLLKADTRLGSGCWWEPGRVPACPPVRCPIPGAQPSPGGMQDPAPAPSWTPSCREGTAALEAHGCPRGASAALSLPSVTALPCGCQTLQLQQRRSKGPRSCRRTDPGPSSPSPARGGAGQSRGPLQHPAASTKILYCGSGMCRSSVQYKPTAAMWSPADRHATAAPEAHPRGAEGAGGGGRGPYVALGLALRRMMAR